MNSEFLHSELNEEVFMKQSLGHKKKGEEGKVYKLKKVLSRHQEHGIVR